jgi:hypothetical protein
MPILTFAARSRGAAETNNKRGPIRWVVGSSPQAPRVVGVQRDGEPRVPMYAQPGEGERLWQWAGKQGWVEVA